MRIPNPSLIIFDSSVHKYHIGVSKGVFLYEKKPGSIWKRTRPGLTQARFPVVTRKGHRGSPPLASSQYHCAHLAVRLSGVTVGEWLGPLCHRMYKCRYGVLPLLSIYSCSSNSWVLYNGIWYRCAYLLPYSISIIYTLYTTTIHYIGNLAIIIFIGVQARIGVAAPYM